jgi:hypothetical protein
VLDGLVFARQRPLFLSASKPIDRAAIDRAGQPFYVVRLAHPPASVQRVEYDGSGGYTSGWAET